MATLKGEVKAFIVQSLACFDTPSMVVDAVKKEFGIVISRQQVESHDPTKANGRGLAKKWSDMFHATRERFQTELADIPIANKAFRLRALDRMATRTEGMKNFALTAQLIEQAAKECGDAYTNRQKIEHTGKDGGPIEAATLTREEYKKARQEMLQDDDC